MIQMDKEENKRLRELLKETIMAMCENTICKKFINDKTNDSYKIEKLNKE